MSKFGVILQAEGSTQTMGRVILECEHFVPAMVKFIKMNVHVDGAVAGSELYLVSFYFLKHFHIHHILGVVLD